MKYVMMVTPKMKMAEIATEHQLRIVGSAEVDLKFHLIFVKNEVMDIIKTMTQILNIVFQDVEMAIELI